ncbi:MAG: leucine-rich repeat domain-containing protein [Promethearchaeota archaeon]
MEFVIVKGNRFEVKSNELSLPYKGISDINEIEGLEKLTNLKKLDLSNNNITEIKGLEKLTNLSNLNLSTNNISEIKGLETLGNLRFLRLTNNHIKEINGLDNLTNLMTLFLDRNQITEIKGITKLTKLNALYLAGNDIPEIKGIENLKNLKRLDLGKTPKVQREMVKKMENQGLHLKDQRFFEKRQGKRVMGYFIAVLILDLIFTSIIVGVIARSGGDGGNLALAFIIWFGILFFPCMIIVGLFWLYGMANS